LADASKLMFTFLLIGMALSVFILIADSRGVIFDQFVIDWDLSGAWELAFITYMIFFSVGIFYAMMHESHGHFDKGDWMDIMVMIVFSSVGLIALNTMAFGTIQAGINSMVTETYEWSLFYSALLVVFIVNKFIVKR
jgi:hypothetical protein